jgi:hypothetical protein
MKQTQTEAITSQAAFTLSPRVSATLGGRRFDLHQCGFRSDGVLPGKMAGVAELSGSVIESPQGLHSNAYKSSAKARLKIWKIIGVPQTGQTTSLRGVSFAHWSFMHSVVECNLDADQHIGNKTLCGADHLGGPYIRSMLTLAMPAARKSVNRLLASTCRRQRSSFVVPAVSAYRRLRARHRSRPSCHSARLRAVRIWGLADSSAHISV